MKRQLNPLVVKLITSTEIENVLITLNTSYICTFPLHICYAIAIDSETMLKNSFFYSLRSRDSRVQQRETINSIALVFATFFSPFLSALFIFLCCFVIEPSRESLLLFLFIFTRKHRSQLFHLIIFICTG
jgi:hypothetical protein